MFKKLLKKITKSKEEENKISEEIDKVDIKVKEDIDKKDTESIHKEEDIKVEVPKEDISQKGRIIKEKNQDSNEKNNEEINEKEDIKPVEKKSWFSKLKSGLSKTKKGITDKVDNLLKGYTKIDEELFEELEEILITADIGMNTTMHIIEKLEDRVRTDKIKEPSQVKELLKEILIETLDSLPDTKINMSTKPSIILVVGVNGVGKTTSIGKIANKLKNENKDVILAAGDTFRAGAIDQLKVWGERVGVDVISHNEGSDPSAVIYDGIHAVKSRDKDVLICDTAGRLHNKKNLMNELGKVSKIVKRECENMSVETLLVLDATTGQNALQQAKVFKEATDITGLVLTKLDGTAKGGAIIGISKELNIPVKLIGVGEKLDDLQEFKSEEFVSALFGEE